MEERAGRKEERKRGGASKEFKRGAVPLSITTPLSNKQLWVSSNACLRGVGVSIMNNEE
jgi:hypothetical protein